MKDYYVVSDIEGNGRTLINIHRDIAKRSSNYKLFILGNLIGINQDWIRYIEYARLDKNIELIMGSNEFNFLTAFGNRKILEAVQNMSDDKFYDYLKSGYEAGEIDLAEIKACYMILSHCGEQLLGTLRSTHIDYLAEIIDYLDSLKFEKEVTIGDRDFRLVHYRTKNNVKSALKRLGKSTRNLNKICNLMVNSSNLPADMTSDNGETVVFGHECVNRDIKTGRYMIKVDKGLVGINCGASFMNEYSSIACVRLNDISVWYSPIYTAWD